VIATSSLSVCGALSARCSTLLFLLHWIIYTTIRLTYRCFFSSFRILVWKAVSSERILILCFVSSLGSELVVRGLFGIGERQVLCDLEIGAVNCKQRLNQ
jgi:hypothetical protein